MKRSEAIKQLRAEVRADLEKYRTGQISANRYIQNTTERMLKKAEELGMSPPKKDSIVNNVPGWSWSTFQGWDIE